MEEVYKEIILDDDNEMKLQISPAYCGRSIHIYKDYFENDELVKGFTLCMWDDYAFDVFVSNWEMLKQDRISFLIDENDPMFYCYHELLCDLDELVIDSDEYEDDIKKLVIRKTIDNNIELIFVSKLKKLCLDRYQVFIKNIAFDLRSKIDCQNLDTKKRLWQFFESSKNVLLEDYHQITIDEYMLKKLIKK